MEKNNLELGKKIKRFRLINDIRQEDMAETLQVSRATLINYEKGHTAISLDLLNRLESYYPDFKLDDNEDNRPKIISDGIIDFKVVFNILFKKKNYLILTTFLFAVFGGSSSFLFKKYYKAEISLYPAKNELNQGLGQFQAIAMNLGMNSKNNDQSFNIPDVVKSRLIAEKAISQNWLSNEGSKINLIELWGLNKVSRFSFNKNKSPDKAIVIEKAVNKFNDHISVSEDRLTGLIRISTKLEDPIIVASLANFVGQQVQNYIQKENSAQSTKEKLSLEFISGIAQISGNTHQSMFTTITPNRVETLGRSPQPEIITKEHARPVVRPDHKKDSPPAQPVNTDAAQGISINNEKTNPTSATI